MVGRDRPAQWLRDKRRGGARQRLWSTLEDNLPWLLGSPHDDVIILGADYLFQAVLIGDEGDDLLVSGGVGSDDPIFGHNYINGGSGDDVLIGGVRGDDLIGESGDDRIFGGAGHDLLSGDEGRDTLHGGDGNDHLRGGADNDHLFGEAGDDNLDGAFGNDILNGGAGLDTAEYYFADGGVTVDLNAGRAWESLGGFTDRLISIENAGGTFYSDVLRGTDAANRLGGDSGDDQLFGRGGDDVLWGGTGADALSGGGGADLFLFLEADPGRDVISDFDAAAGDRIDVSAIDADSVSWWADDSFTFIGEAAFSGTAGELRVAAGDGGWEVMGDLDGDALADFTILVVSSAPPMAADFVL